MIQASSTVNARHRNTVLLAHRGLDYSAVRGVRWHKSQQQAKEGVTAKGLGREVG